MRVEWLDEDMDRARVVVGWFRKRAAVDHRRRDHDAKSRPVEWEPVRALPAVKVERRRR